MKNLQFSGKLYGEYITLKQVSKVEAKKLFCAGHPVYLQSSNFHPFGVWSQAIDITLDNEELQSKIEQAETWVKNGWETDNISNTPEKQFSEICNNFQYYNCSNEQGRYIHFYKSI